MSFECSCSEFVQLGGECLEIAADEPDDISQHEIVRVDPEYGMVGPTIVARGEAAVEEWLCAHGEDRSALEPRTRAAARIGKALQGVPLRIARAGFSPLGSGSDTWFASDERP